MRQALARMQVKPGRGEAGQAVGRIPPAFRALAGRGKKLCRIVGKIARKKRRLLAEAALLAMPM